VEGEFFDLGEESGLHVAEGDALFGDLSGGGNAGEVLVGFDVRFDFGKWLQRVVVSENVVRPASGFDDDFLGLDRAVNGEFVLRVSFTNADVASDSSSADRHSFITVGNELNVAVGTICTGLIIHDQSVAIGSKAKGTASSGIKFYVC
jgi:hypothetical protein